MVVPFTTAGGTVPMTVVGNITSVGSGTTGAGGQNQGANLGEKGPGQQQLQQGEVLQAKVVGSDGEGRYTLEAGGIRVQVESRTPLTPGQTLNLQVLQGEKGLMLALQSPDAGQFLTRSLATGGSGAALQTIFGGGLARQAVQSALTQGESAAQTGAPAASAGRAGGEASPVGTPQTSAQVTPQGAAQGTPQGSPQTVLTATPGTITPGALQQGAQSAAQPGGKTPVAAHLANLQQQFVSRSETAPAGPPSPQQFAGAVNQFVNQAGQAMAPLLAQGRSEEALAQLSSGLRALAQFFPAQATPQGLSSGGQQLFQTLSFMNRAGAAGPTASGGGVAQMAESALGRLVNTLGSQLTPAAGGGSSATAMLTSLQSSLIELQPLVNVPSSFQGMGSVSAGFDSLFAWNLGAGGGSAESAAATAAATGTAATSLPAGTSATNLSSGEMLRDMVQGLGLDMERRLGRGDTERAGEGLKFQLAQELESAKGAVESGDSTQLRRAGEAHQTLQSLEFLQVLQANLEKQGILVVPLPLPFLEQGFMTLEEESGDGGSMGGETESARFSVLMKLSTLGNIRVDFYQTRQEVYIRFHTSSPQVSSLLQENQQELRAGLRPLKVQGPSFSSDAEDPLSSLLRRCEGSSGGGSSLFSASI